MSACIERNRRKRFGRLLGAVAVWLLVVPRAGAQTIPDLTTTQGTLRAKAQPDECFSAIGANIPYSKPPCLVGQPKVNQAYVWSMTEAHTDIWFGTAANPQCLAQSGLSPDPSTLFPYRTPSWVCEFGSGPYSPWLLPAAIGDFRPPQIFVWDREHAVQIEQTPKVPPTPLNPLGFDPLISATRGIRAAATIGNLVMMAGPSLFGGLNFFFFQADTRAYLGSGTLPGFNNIRQFTTFRGELYVAVGQTGVGGAVLKWNGHLTGAPCLSCLSFETVGTLDGIGVYIVHHHKRLFVTTWPSGLPGSLGALYMSPRVPEDGLKPADAGRWKKVWDASDFEPDPAIATTYAGGALASFDGYLYWGTMHVPWAATAAELGAYGAPTTDQGWTEALVGTFRTAVVFRGRKFGRGHPEVDLLYGSHILPVFTPPSDDQPSGKWEWLPNNMPPDRRVPLYGYSGFGNWYNNYIWSMTVWNGRLWVGTMDWGYPAEQGSEVLFAAPGQPLPFPITTFFSLQNFGGDLYFFQDSKTPAVAESTTGVGNITSFGIRTMVSTAKSLFLGMANDSNLLTGPQGPRGGWELIELSPRLTKPFILLTHFFCAPIPESGSGTTTCTATTSRPAPAGGLTMGVIAIAPLPPGMTVNAPLTVWIPPGETCVRFEVGFDGVTTDNSALLIAGLNGGSRVTALQLGPEEELPHGHTPHWKHQLDPRELPGWKRDGRW